MESVETNNDVLLNIEEEETTYDKGRQLEHEFAEFMKQSLQWNKVRVGAHLPGKMNRKGASIDVIGESLDDRGRRFHNIAIIWILIACGLFFLGVVWAVDNFDNGGIGFMIFSLMFGLGGIFFKTQSDKMNKRNAWVECKNLKNRANINHVRKSIEEFRDYKASGDKEYKFDTHYFISANGYVENALKHAMESGIDCYEKKDGKIVKSAYWK